MQAKYESVSQIENEWKQAVDDLLKRIKSISPPPDLLLTQVHKLQLVIPELHKHVTTGLIDAKKDNDSNAIKQLKEYDEVFKCFFGTTNSLLDLNALPKTEEKTEQLQVILDDYKTKSDQLAASIAKLKPIGPFKSLVGCIVGVIFGAAVVAVVGFGLGAAFGAKAGWGQGGLIGIVGSIVLGVVGAGLGTVVGAVTGTVVLPGVIYSTVKAGNKIKTNIKATQQALIEAYRPLSHEAKDSKSQVRHQVLAQLRPDVPVDPELTKPLETAYATANRLDTEIPHHNSLVQKEIEINTATQDNTVLQTLYERRKGYKDPDLKEQLFAQLKQKRPDFKPQIDAKQFLQHIAYGEQDEAEALLQKDPELAQELLSAHNIPFTDYSGRTFTCTAYEYAWWAKDTHMCRMLERHMDDATKAKMSAHIDAMERDGLVYKQHGQVHHSAHFDLKPLETALKEYITGYSNWAKIRNFQQIKTAWMKIGLAQRDLPAHIAHEYCTLDRNFKTTPSFIVNDEAWPRTLEIYNDDTECNETWFPLAVTPNSGLGYNFALFRGGLKMANMEKDGMMGYVGTIAEYDLKAITRLDEVRTDDLRQSREFLREADPEQGHGLRI